MCLGIVCHQPHAVVAAHTDMIAMALVDVLNMSITISGYHIAKLNASVPCSIFSIPTAPLTVKWIYKSEAGFFP